MTPSSFSALCKRSIWAVFFLLVATGTDQALKFLVRAHLPLGKEVPILPFLSWLHAENRGVAFSLLSSFQNTSLILFTLALILFLFFLYFRADVFPSLRAFSYLLLLSGALGNLMDRVLCHGVTDYIYFHLGQSFRFAIFNLADCFITCGAALVLLEEVFFSKTRACPPSPKL